MDKDPTFWGVLSTRRSIRTFVDRPVPNELIEKLLKTAILAPSAHNAQHWRFVVMTKDEDKLRLAERMGRAVRVGSYTDISDSFHLYGSYFTEFEPELAKMRSDPDYTRRAWPSDHPAVEMMFEETRQKLEADPDFMRAK